MKPVVACGTSDGDSLFEDHFGESPFFHIYRVNPKSISFIEKVENFSRHKEESAHGDPRKAKTVGSLLKSKSVNVLLAHQMGPNVVRISKDFVPIISRTDDIEKTLSLLQDKLYLVDREWRKGEKREHLVLEENETS